MSYEEMSSTGSRDDLSSAGEPEPLETAQNPPAAFYQHLHAWLVLHDRHNYLTLKNERIDAEGTPESIQEREAERVECRTTEINMERARSSLRDWLIPKWAVLLMSKLWCSKYKRANSFNSGPNS
jgi:hypothetical protein